jgi:hypothetical protein
MGEVSSTGKEGGWISYHHQAFCYLPRCSLKFTICSSLPNEQLTQNGKLFPALKRENHMAVHPKFSHHTFDHMRRLIHKMKNKAVAGHDEDMSGDAELLDALLLRFVEGLIVAGSIVANAVR